MWENILPEKRINRFYNKRGQHNTSVSAAMEYGACTSTPNKPINTVVDNLAHLTSARLDRGDHGFVGVDGDGLDSRADGGRDALLYIEEIGLWWKK